MLEILVLISIKKCFYFFLFYRTAFNAFHNFIFKESNIFNSIIYATKNMSRKKYFCQYEWFFFFSQGVSKCKMADLLIN